MASGYYNHEQISKSAAQILGDKKQLLELGIGTGLLAEQMIKLGYDITGIDFSTKMLEIAKKRLHNTAILLLQDVLSLNLLEQFEGVLSEGGIWLYTRDNNGQLYMESHLSNYEDNLKGWLRVAAAVKTDGLILVGIQPVHRDLEMTLETGTTYLQSVQYNLPLIEKDYFIKQGNSVLAHQHCTYLRLTPKEIETILKECGLSSIGESANGDFFVLQKQ